MLRAAVKLALCIALCSGFSINAFSNGQSGLERLGRAIFKDKKLSLFANQSCQSCHHPRAKFADPANIDDPIDMPVSTGSDGFSVGGRNAPTAAYAGFIPVFQELEPGLYAGGMFWDGRATGHELGDPLAEQARGPFLNPVEMALPDKQSVITIISESRYAKLFQSVYPGTDFNDTSPQNINLMYDKVAMAIAAFERTKRFNPFSSPFDDFWYVCESRNIPVSEIGISIDPSEAPQGILEDSELRGLALFNGKALCSQCHPTTNFVDSQGNVLPPMFTDFTYDNLGLPKNTRIDQLKNEVQPIDYGLGARSDIAVKDPVVVPDGLGGLVTVSSSQAGKFKVSTLRNIEHTPPYGHNGFFATLAEIVHFYNTRDVPNAGWAHPEVIMNMNKDELGNLELTPQEEEDLVDFLKTLSDEN